MRMSNGRKASFRASSKISMISGATRMSAAEAINIPLGLKINLGSAQNSMPGISSNFRIHLAAYIEI